MATTYQGTHIVFYEGVPANKTRRWEIVSKDGGDHLGDVKWFARWRKYAFLPAAGAVFEEDCLGEISRFIVARTHEHRAARAAA